MRLWSGGLIALLVVLAGAIASAVAAPSRETDFVMVFGPAQADCPAGRVPRATVAEITANPGRYSGKCVRVAGIWAEFDLYADLEAYYRRERPQSPYRDRSKPPAGRIGVYAPPDLLDRKGANYWTPVQADVVGRVGTCGQLAKLGWIAGGYCHYAGGPFLAVEDADLRPQRLVRMVSEQDRFALGDLAVAPADWSLRPLLGRLVQKWLRAYADRDATGIADLMDLAAEDRRGNWDRQLLDADPPFADFLRWRADRQVEIFVAKARDAAGPDTSVEDWDVDAVGCVCREADCTGRWPIRHADAANHPSRPFICLELNQMGVGAPRHWEIALMPMDNRRLIEPGR